MGHIRSHVCELVVYMIRPAVETDAAYFASVAKQEVSQLGVVTHSCNLVVSPHVSSNAQDGQSGYV